MRRIWRCVLAAFQYKGGLIRKTEKAFFTRVRSDRTRDNDFKLRESKFRLTIRKKLFTSPSLEMFKARLDGPLSNPAIRGFGARWFLRSLPIQTILWYYSSINPMYNGTGKAKLSEPENLSYALKLTEMWTVCPYKVQKHHKL